MITLREYIEKLNGISSTNAEYLDLPMVRYIAGGYFNLHNFPSVGYLNEDDEFIEFDYNETYKDVTINVVNIGY